MNARPFDCLHYGYLFHGVWNRFEVGLLQSGSLDDQPFGLIGQSYDMTGRMTTPASRGGKHRMVSRSGPVVMLKNVWPHITHTALAVGDRGDARLWWSLFFCGKPYGLLAKTSMSPGQAVECCCSPDIFFKLEKVALGEQNPLRLIQQDDFQHGFFIADWTVMTHPQGWGVELIKSPSDLPHLRQRLDYFYEHFRNSLQ